MHIILNRLISLILVIVFSRVVNIGYRSIADTVSPILFQYRSRYRYYFPAQVSCAVSAILFLIKNPIFIRYFFIKNNFFHLDSFSDLDIRIWCQPLSAGRLLLRRDAM